MDSSCVCLSLCVCVCVCVWDMSVVVWMMMAKHVGNAKNKRFIGQVSRRASNYIFFSPLLLGWKIAKTGHGINVNVFIFSIKKKKKGDAPKCWERKKKNFCFAGHERFCFYEIKSEPKIGRYVTCPGRCHHFARHQKKKKK